MLAPSSLVRPLSHVLLAVVLGGLAGCSKPATAPTVGAPKSAPSTVPTRIVSFSVSNENLNVDKVGLRDGLMKPDGARDLVFSASIEGPFEAVFIVSTNAKGEPGYGLRADTLVSNEEVPLELGGVIDTGKMTVGVGVLESGKFINAESGSVRAGPGTRNLTLYVPNTATLHAGSFVRLYLRIPGGTLLAGPIAPY